MKKKRLRKIPGGEANVRKEIELLRRLRHPNVIALEQVLYADSREKTYLVMEYCVTGLQNLLDKAEGKKFPIWQAHNYFSQLVAGLDYLHSHGVVHRDIKPGNILLTRDGTVKISDFGVAEQLDPYLASDISISSLGSPAFQPPEIALGREEFSAFKVDIWAAGVTLYNMVTGAYPFMGTNLYNLFQNIGAGEFTLPDSLDPALQDLIRRMLTHDPATRASLADVRSHPWVTTAPPRDPSQPAVPLLDPPTALISGLPPPTTTLLPYLEAMYPSETPTLQPGPGGSASVPLLSPAPPGHARRDTSTTASSSLQPASSTSGELRRPGAPPAGTNSSSGSGSRSNTWHPSGGGGGQTLGSEGFSAEHKRNISTSSSKIRADLAFGSGGDGGDSPGGEVGGLGEQSSPPSLYDAVSLDPRREGEGENPLVGRRPSSTMGGPGSGANAEEREGLFHTLLRKLSFRKRKSVRDIADFLGSTENMSSSS